MFEYSFSEIPAELQMLILDKIPDENLAIVATVNTFWEKFSREKFTENHSFIRYQKEKKMEHFLSPIYENKIKGCRKKNQELRIPLVKAVALAGLSLLLSLSAGHICSLYGSIPVFYCAIRIIMSQKPKIFDSYKELNKNNRSIQEFEALIKKRKTTLRAILDKSDGKNL